MTKNVLVFQELLTQLPAVKTALDDWGANVTPVSGGKDVLSQLSGRPHAIVLDVAMPQMSGIECCRQIKEGGLAPKTKVILVSAIDSSSIRERAENAGCDLFTGTSDVGVRLPQFLSRAAENSGAPNPDVFMNAAPLLEPAVAPQDTDTNEPKEPLARKMPRVPASEIITIEIGASKRNVEMLNFSCSGLLFGTDTPIAAATKMNIRIRGEMGHEFAVTAVAVKTVTLKEPKKGVPYACGVKFVDVSNEITEKISDLVEAKKYEDELAAQLSPEYLESILQADPTFLKTYVAGETKDATLEFIGAITEFEKRAFSSEDAASDCVRRMVLLRVQSNAYRIFVARVEANSQALAPTYLREVSELMSRIGAIESETEAHVKQAVAGEDETLRTGLNEVSNRLHQANTQLIFQIARRLSTYGLGPEARILEDIQNRADNLQALAQNTSEVIKYLRKQAPAPKVEREKITKGEKPIFKRPLFIGSMVGVLAVVGFVWVPYMIFSRVSQNELKIPLKITRAVKDDDNGLVIHSTRAAWDELNKHEREQLFIALESYLEKRKMAQMKIVDENEKNLAAISSAVSGTKRFYARRTF